MCIGLTERRDPCPGASREEWGGERDVKDSGCVCFWFVLHAWVQCGWCFCISWSIIACCVLCVVYCVLRVSAFFFFFCLFFCLQYDGFFFSLVKNTPIKQIRLCVYGNGFKASSRRKKRKVRRARRERGKEGRRKKESIGQSAHTISSIQEQQQQVVMKDVA